MMPYFLYNIISYDTLFSFHSYVVEQVARIEYYFSIYTKTNYNNTDITSDPKRVDQNQQRNTG